MLAIPPTPAHNGSGARVLNSLELIQENCWQSAEEAVAPVKARDHQCMYQLFCALLVEVATNVPSVVQLEEGSLGDAGYMVVQGHSRVKHCAQVPGLLGDEAMCASPTTTESDRVTADTDFG